LSIIFLIAGGLFFGYALIYKPEIIAIVLFTIIIAEINVYNLRPILTLALFVRILIDRSKKFRYPTFIFQSEVKMLVIFVIYRILVALWQNLFSYDFFKGDLDTIILTFCVYYYYFRLQNANLLKTAMIISGLICFGDLAYTYIVFGSFPIHRLYYEIGGIAQHLTEEDLDVMANWNFFGQICGMAFVYILSDFVKNKTVNKILIWLLPVMLLGVIMSTSRSAILALLLISILIILNGVNYREQKRRLAKIGAIGFGSAFVVVLLLSTVGKYINLETRFIDDITSRLTEEPIAIMKKAMGQSYNIQNLGSMDWREESAENAYAAYMNLPLTEQVFGIGVGGFEVRNIGHGFNAHNALLLLLIENGIIGAVIYFMIVIGTIIQSLLKKNFSPSLAVVCFILIYGLGQNRQWTGWTAFLFIYCLVAEVEFISWKRKNHQNTLADGHPRTIQSSNA
jgi:hypothetical protein